MAKKSYNMYEAKTKLSEIVEAARAGQEVILMNRGAPVAKVVPIEREPSRRKLGFLKARIRLTRGWDAPIPDFDGYR
jgi:prevent-host-death family protein